MWFKLLFVPTLGIIILTVFILEDVCHSSKLGTQSKQLGAGRSAGQLDGRGTTLDGHGGGTQELLLSSSKLLSSEMEVLSFSETDSKKGAGGRRKGKDRNRNLALAQQQAQKELLAAGGRGGANNNHNTSSSSSSSSSSTHIRINVVDEADAQLCLKVLPSTCFADILNFYCQRHEMLASEMVLRYCGQKVHLGESPESLNLLDMEQVDVEYDYYKIYTAYKVSTEARFAKLEKTSSERETLLESIEAKMAATEKVSRETNREKSELAKQVEGLSGENKGLCEQITKLEKDMATHKEARRQAIAAKAHAEEELKGDSTQKEKKKLEKELSRLQKLVGEKTDELVAAEDRYNKAKVDAARELMLEKSKWSDEVKTEKKKAVAAQEKLTKRLEKLEAELSSSSSSSLSSTGSSSSAAAPAAAPVSSSTKPTSRGSSNGGSRENNHVVRDVRENRGAVKDGGGEMEKGGGGGGDDDSWQWQTVSKGGGKDKRNNTSAQATTAAVITTPTAPGGGCLDKSEKEKMVWLQKRHRELDRQREEERQASLQWRQQATALEKEVRTLRQQLLQQMPSPQQQQQHQSMVNGGNNSKDNINNNNQLQQQHHQTNNPLTSKSGGSSYGRSMAYPQQHNNIHPQQSLQKPHQTNSNSSSNSNGVTHSGQMQTTNNSNTTNNNNGGWGGGGGHPGHFPGSLHYLSSPHSASPGLDHVSPHLLLHPQLFPSASSAAASGSAAGGILHMNQPQNHLNTQGGLNKLNHLSSHHLLNNHSSPSPLSALNAATVAAAASSLVASSFQLPTIGSFGGLQIIDDSFPSSSSSSSSSAAVCSTAGDVFATSNNFSSFV